MSSSEVKPHSDDTGRIPYSTELCDLATSYNTSCNTIATKETMLGHLMVSREQLAAEQPELEGKMGDSILEQAFVKDETTPAADAEMDRSAERLSDINEGLIAIDGSIAAKSAERTAAVNRAAELKGQLDALPTIPPQTPRP